MNDDCIQCVMVPIPRTKASELLRLAKLEALPGWLTGKIIARRALVEQATSEKEQDEHWRAINEYEKRITAAGFQ